MDGIEEIALEAYVAEDPANAVMDWHCGRVETGWYVAMARAVLRALAPTIDPLLAACGRCGGGGLVVDGPVDYGLTGNASRACPACGPIRALLAGADNGS